MAEKNANCSILLIEENEKDYQRLSSMLGELSSDKVLTIHRQKDYQSGYQEAIRNQHDVYLVSDRLKSQDGMDLIRDLSEQNPYGPYILLANPHAGDCTHQSWPEGLFEYIRKVELTPLVLRQMIAYVLKRFEIEKNLREEKEFRAFIVNEMPYLVVSVAQDGLITSANRVVLELLGMSENHLNGQPWKKILHPEDWDGIRYNIAPNGNVSFQARILSAKEKEHHIDWNVLSHNFDPEQQENTAFVLSGKDITEQVTIEIHERKRQKMEALGQLAGGVAHEINNLLQPIMMSAQLSLSTLCEEDSEFLVKNLHRIQRNTQSAAKIVDDILLFSRGEAKETAPVYLNNAIDRSVQFVRDILPVSLRIEYFFEDEIQHWIADINEQALTQIMTNMLINAAQAMSQKGKVEITVTLCNLDPREASEFNLSAGAYMCINILDEGCGIAQEHLEKIFQPFFTTKEVGDGTGLGLAIVYKTIADWGGTIQVDSELNSGTRFKIYIPVYQER